jgi:hypothetical protein
MPQEEHKFTEKEIQQLVAFFDYLDECEREIRRRDKLRAAALAPDGGKGVKSLRKPLRKPACAPSLKN